MFKIRIKFSINFHQKKELIAKVQKNQSEIIRETKPIQTFSKKIYQFLFSDKKKIPCFTLFHFQKKFQKYCAGFSK